MQITRSLFIIVPLLVFGIALTSSCEKKVIELTPSPVDVLPEKSLYAIVDGAVFTDTVLWAEEDGGVLTITATENGENDYSKLILKMPSDIGVGSYELGGPQSDNQALIEFGPLPDQKFESIDSTSLFVVTTHFKESRVMRGKFIFNAEVSSGNQSISNIEVWSGNFVISY